MEMKKVFIIIKEDVVQYPPVLSMIQVLYDLNYKVIHIGVYSDIAQKKELENIGVEFRNDIRLNTYSGYLKKIKEQLAFKRYVKKVLRSEYTPGDIVCVVNEDTVCLLWNVIKQYDPILYFLELTGFNVRPKYRIYAPTFSLKKACQKVSKIICCEYNRAHIMKGLYQLDKLPYILPNKYYATQSLKANTTIPQDVQMKIQALSEKIKGKKVVLYQGAFTSKERRLEEFISAINAMPEDYVLIAMGGGTIYKDLKKVYSSKKVIFVDFIQPPYHLEVTRLAHIGVLSYFPNDKSLVDILNPIYCAPNKIFEYSKYSLPMISNDLPSLKMVFQEYHCGETVGYPIDDIKIKEKLERIFQNYEMYSEGAKKFYDSVDVKLIIKEIMH